jgi:hypothetical protein
VKAIRLLAWTIAVLIPLTITPKALAANVFPGVGSVDFNESSNTLSVVIPYQARNPYRVQWLNGQQRLVVDVEGMRLPSNRAMYIGMGVVQQIRATKLRAGVTRLVFDLQQSADLRTLTDVGSRTLTLTVFPRGGSPAVPYSYAPAPRPTRRPAPISNPQYPNYSNYPLPNSRITPAPVMQPSFAPIAVPTPAPIVRYTPMPTPQPTFVPMPRPTTDFSSNEGPSNQEFAVFGSRVDLGLELPLSFNEAYPAGNSLTSIGFIPGGTVEWTQMFGPYVGFGLGTHAMSYTLEDTEGAAAGQQIRHKRGDYEFNIGPRGRLPLPFGLEMYAQPGFLLRKVTVDSTAQALSADGTVNTASPATAFGGESYLNSGFTGYGAQLQVGLGYHAFGPLSLAVLGEYNALLAGGMDQASVPTILPLMGFRAGAEARLDFGLLDMALGYNYTSYGNSGLVLSQSWTGPYAKIGIAY